MKPFALLPLDWEQDVVAKANALKPYYTGLFRTVSTLFQAMGSSGIRKI